MGEAVEYRPGMTTKALAIALPLAIFYAFLGCVLGLYTDKPGTFGTFVIPMVYLVLLFEVLGRLNPRLRFSPQEMAFMFVIFTFLAQHSYIFMHAAAHNDPISYTWITVPLSDYLAFTIDSLRDFWSQSVPAVVVPPEPLRFEVGRLLLYGVPPGQAAPLGTVLGTLFYWGLVYTFYSFISMFITFTFGKPWVEEERLVFPIAIPSLYLFREAGEVSGGGNKSRLFDFSLPSTKVFWAMFFVGVVSGINPIIAELFPAFPIGAWWGETKLTFPWLAALWPGVYAAAVFYIPQLAIGLLLPNDVLITCILGWVIFGVLYQGIGVMTGTVPYNPGMEFVWPWENFPGHWMPFPYRLIGQNGFALAIAVWIIYRYRRRIASVLSTLWRGNAVERGLPLRMVAFLLVAGVVGWYVLMLVEGADPLIAILVPLWTFVYMLFQARIWSEVFWTADWGYVWDLNYQAGVVLRGWPSNYDTMWDNPNTSPAWMTINRHLTNVSCWTIGFSSLSAGAQLSLYRVSYGVNMRLKDFLMALIIGVLVMVFVAMPLEAYMVLHTQGGMSSTNAAGGSWWPWAGAGHYHRGRWVPEGVTPDVTMWLLYGVGFVLGIALYLLKTRFTWFWFINPAAFYAGMTGVIYLWLVSLLALIIKYVAIRTVGMKRYEEYAMPAVAGWILGFGATWLPAAIINISTVAIPKWLALYKP